MYLIIHVDKTHVYFSCIFGLHPWFLAHSSQIIQNFLSYKSNGSIFCTIFDFLSSVPGSASEPWGKMGVIFITSLLHQTVYINEVNLWEVPKDGSWFLAEATVKGALELSVTMSDFRGLREQLEVESITNHQWVHQRCLRNELSTKTQKEEVWRISRLRN